MEIKHCICKNLQLIIGEIGPVEVELIYSVIFLGTGTVWGSACFDKTLAELTGLAFLDIKLKYSVTALTIGLLLIFTHDNIKDCLATNLSLTFRLFQPVFVLIALSFLSAHLPSMQEETCIVYFLYQAAFSTIILKLMLYNMAGRPFEQVHSQYMFPLLPVIAYQVLGVSPHTEVWVTRLSFVAALVEFFWIVARISK